MLSSRRQLIALSFDLWFTSAKIGVLPTPYEPTGPRRILPEASTHKRLEPI